MRTPLALVLFVLNTLLMPVLVALVIERCPDIARWLIRQASRCLPKRDRERYVDEWLADLEATRRGDRGDEDRSISMLLAALSIIRSALALRFTLAPLRPSRTASLVCAYAARLMTWMRRRMQAASLRRARLTTGLSLGLVMALVAMLLLGFIGTTVGTAGLLVGLLLAFVPVLPVLATFLWIDRYEPGPRGRIVFSVVWGASLAAFFALLVNSASVRLITAVGGSGHETAAVWVAPWIEEAAKGAAVVLVLLLRRHKFNGIIDGIVIAGLSGLGFAFMENILIFGRIFEKYHSDDGPISGVFVVGVVFAVRAVFAPFAHAMFTAAFGIGLGLAAQHARSWRKAAAPAVGFLVAVVLHGVWNLSVVHGPGRFITAYVLVMVPVFAGFVGIVLWARKRERTIK